MKKKVWIALVVMFALGILGSLVQFEKNANSLARVEASPESPSAEEFLEFLAEFSPGDAEACTLCPDGTLWGPWCCGVDPESPPGCIWSYFNCYHWVESQAAACNTWFLPAWVYDPMTGGCHVQMNFCSC